MDPPAGSCVEGEKQEEAGAGEALQEAQSSVRCTPGPPGGPLASPAEQTCQTGQDKAQNKYEQCTHYIQVKSKGWKSVLPNSKPSSKQIAAAFSHR